MRAKSSSPPALPYQEALKRRFLAPNGEVLSVGRCDAYAFVRAIEGYLRPYRAKPWYRSVQTELAGLDYTDMLSRWYALEVIQDHLALVWSGSEEEDERS